jgi:hypothetical protein
MTCQQCADLEPDPDPDLEKIIPDPDAGSSVSELNLN